MGKARKFNLNIEASMEFLKQVAIDKPFYLLLVPLISALWVFEKWVFSVSSWVPLVIAVWAALQVSFLSILLFPSMSN